MSLADNQNVVAERVAGRRRVCLGLAFLLTLVFLCQAVGRASGPGGWNDSHGHLLLYVTVSLTVALGVYRGWDIGLLGMLAASGLGASFRVVRIDHLLSTTVCAFAGLAGGIAAGAFLRGSTAMANELRSSLVPPLDPLVVSTLQPYSDRRSHQPLWCFSFAVLLFATGNFLLLPIESISRRGTFSELAMCVCVGAIGAQASLHAIWVVLVPVASILRISMGLAGVFVLYAAWALGLAVVSAEYPVSVYMNFWDPVLTGLACLPLLALAIQAPVWMMRFWNRWQIVHEDDEHLPGHSGSLQIAHLLIATGSVAAALTVARAGRLDGVSSDTGFLTRLLVAAAVAGATSLLTTLPLTYATLGARRVWLAMVATVLLGVMAVAGTIAVLSIVEQSTPPSDFYFQCCCMLASFYVATGGVLLVARRMGYRLLHRRDAHMNGPCGAQASKYSMNDRSP